MAKSKIAAFCYAEILGFMQTLTIVSRTSALAMWQAEHVRSRLQQYHPHLSIQILGIKTQGDTWLDKPLYEMGGKSVFVKELEQSLLNGQAHLAVHSLKDVPVELAPGLKLAAICERENPLDAWICPQDLNIRDLPPQSKVGTSSLRRILQLQCLRPDLQYVPIRGNVDNRLKKCLKGELDAIVLAVAGLKRLNLDSHITEIFTAEKLLPAVGQGALAIECRSDDQATQKLLAVLNHPPTEVAVRAERAMNKALGGNCQVAVAGFAELKNNALFLRAKVGDPARDLLIEANKTASSDQPEALGLSVAQDLIAQGALEIIAQMKQG